MPGVAVPDPEIGTLAGKLELLHAEQQRRDLELAQLRAALEQERSLAGAGHSAVEGRLAELEQSGVALAGEHAAIHERIAAFEATQADAVQRLETRCNQLKFLQDSERGQFRELRTALAEATSRLETRDDALEGRLDGVDERIGGVESVQQGTAARLNALGASLEDIGARQQRQAHEVEATHAVMARELEASGRLVSALEQRIEQTHRAQQAMIQETNARWESRYKRIRIVMTVTLIVLVGLVLYLVF